MKKKRKKKGTNQGGLESGGFYARKEDYSAVANYIRTKIRFALLKSVLISLRGVRGKQKKDSTMPTSAVAFGLIPEKVSYEAY